mmetsp:Transcript_3337/g.2841  ORF Transcript_3337/g.2841 Transcript_3337/m.2841 type:complete len:280 (-) Transcript_3337:89-928(-)
MDIVRFDYEETVDRVKSKHKRKVSQLQALESELGLYFDEEEAERIAKQTMKEMNPNNSAVEQVSVEHIVAKARKEHKRKVSQFGAIKDDIGQYLPKDEAGRFAKEIMKEFNPNDKSGKPSQILVNEIVDKAMNEHQRRKSQMMAIKGDLGLIFDKDDVNAIAKDVMKKMFAQKKITDYFGSKNGNKNGNDGDIANMDQLEKGYSQQLKRKIDRLEKALKDKDDEMDRLKEQMKNLEESKRKLAMNSSKCLNDMRGYLLIYQNAVFRTNNNSDSNASSNS